MKKIFKTLVYKIETKVFSMINNMIDKVDGSYKCIKSKNEIESRELVARLKRHIILTHRVITILNEHIQKLNKVK